MRPLARIPKQEIQPNGRRNLDGASSKHNPKSLSDRDVHPVDQPCDRKPLANGFAMGSPQADSPEFRRSWPVRNEQHLIRTNHANNSPKLSSLDSLRAGLHYGIQQNRAAHSCVKRRFRPYEFRTPASDVPPTVLTPARLPFCPRILF